MLRLRDFILFFVLCSFTIVGDYRIIPNDSFKAGESYNYKVKYGFLTIGEAKVDVDEKIYMVNNRPCFRVNVLGKTAGLTDLFKVRNTYRSYVDTLAFLPHRFIYSARENSYQRDQVMNFDHQKNEVVTVEKEQSKRFEVTNNI